MRWLLAVSCTLHLAVAATDSTYTQSVEQWRAAREAKLKADDGWLTVSGLFWLKPGVNTMGHGRDPLTSRDATVALPYGPAVLGVFQLSNGLVTLQPQEAKADTASITSSKSAGESYELKLNGKPAVASALKTDKSGSPDLLTYGRVTMFVIQRGPRFGIRMRDLDSQFRREFTHLNWYAVNPAYCVTGTYEAYSSKHHVKIDTIIGEPDDMIAPGKVTFVLNGRTATLEPVEDEGKLWYIFRDGTTNKTTYGGGRFLYSELPKDGKVILDFNEAYNPPCVFTPYATCPLPTPQNRLTIPIEAGEKRYGKH